MLPPDSSRPILLILPGMVCGPASWQQQNQALAQHMDVVIAEYGDADHVTSMAQVLLNTHSGPLLLAGHSMGGRVALEMQRLAPERVLGLCLISTESRARPEGERGLAEDDARQRLYQLALEEGMVAMATAWIPQLLGPQGLLDTALRAALQKMIGSHSCETLARHINAGKTRPHSYDHLPQISCPTLLIAGERDALRPPAVLEEMHQAMAHSSFLIIEGCGHMPMMEAANEVTQAMLTWLHRSLTPTETYLSLEASQ